MLRLIKSHVAASKIEVIVCVLSPAVVSDGIVVVADLIRVSTFVKVYPSTYSLLAALLLEIGVPTFLISLSLKLKSFALKVIEVLIGLVS